MTPAAGPACGEVPLTEVAMPEGEETCETGVVG